MTTTIYMPRAADLRIDAEQALARGETIRVERTRAHANPSITVETLIVGDRAGQAINGDAIWGDWDDDAQTISTEDGYTFRLDGSEVVSCRGCGQRISNCVARPIGDDEYYCPGCAADADL